MKKLLFLLLPVTLQLCAMQHNPNVRVEQVGNITRYTLAPKPVPKIAIQECAQCGKKASQKCSGCSLTYYCSQECQRKNWKLHKSPCQEIKGAQRGDIECMRAIFTAYMNAAIQTKKKKYALEGINWHYRTLIRMRQDIACSKDASTQGGIEKVQFEHGSLMQQLFTQNIFTAEELSSTDSFREALSWVKKQTENRTLVPPYDIRRYGMKAFINAEMNEAEEFLPNDQWYEKRMGMLQKYEEN